MGMTGLPALEADCQKYRVASVCTGSSKISSLKPKKGVILQPSLASTHHGTAGAALVAEGLTQRILIMSVHSKSTLQGSSTWVRRLDDVHLMYERSVYR